MKDEEHLEGCIAWLLKAQSINPGGGVSAMYYIDTKQWHYDYPETTGYIIPTFLAYAKYKGDGYYTVDAINMGDWLIEIQLPDGGIGEPVGAIQKEPRIYNTSQVILGWLALHTETVEVKFLNAAIKAGDWIVSKQDEDGKWTENTYAGPKAYHVRVAWVLYELYKITGDKKYMVAAGKSFEWVLSQANKNGWLESNTLDEGHNVRTHLIAYALVGIKKLSGGFDIEGVLNNAAANIVSYCVNAKYFIPGTFDKNWNSTDDWSCLTGSSQLAFFLREMKRAEWSDIIVDDLKEQQFLKEEDSNTYGGLPGSCPIGAGYMPNIIPNWGVKFFADALLQKLVPHSEHKFLG
ncbi:MAG: terpene cyclase/mutase family protein [Thermodesulfovibrionia bacterium]|nr:terpene cyclase/mutase family protein [Thermodesulfovibrionia bacterium]